MPKKIIIFLIFLLYYSVSSLSALELSTVRMGVPSRVNHLIPGKLVSYSERCLMAHVFESLVSYKKNQLTLNLVKSWQQEDFVRWTFHLDRSIRFHDGSTLCARDVKKSLEAIDLSLQQNKPFTNIRSISIKGDENIEINLITADSNFIYYLSLPQTGIWKKRSDWSWPLGTGPFLIEELISDRVTLTAFKDRVGVIPLKRIELVSFTNGQSMIDAYLKGQIHICPLIIDDYLKAMAKIPEQARLSKYHTRNIVILKMNTDHPLFQKKKVYDGLQTAFSRKPFKVLLAGQLDENVGWYPFASDVVPLEYNTQQASRALNNVKIPPAMSIKYISVFGSERLVFNKIASCLEEVGFQRIKTERVSEDQLFFEVQQKKYEFAGEIIFADIDLPQYYEKCLPCFQFNNIREKTFFPLYSPTLNVLHREGLRDFTVQANGVIDFRSAYWQGVE